ncbi:MAG TPA: hypothetical protein VGF69_05585 [Thermoanaerobaculia bacterium]
MRIDTVMFPPDSATTTCLRLTPASLASRCCEIPRAGVAVTFELPT